MEHSKLCLAWTMQALQKACEFLLHVQRDDGGWAESYLSCVVRTGRNCLHSDAAGMMCTICRRRSMAIRIISVACSPALHGSQYPLDGHNRIMLLQDKVYTQLEGDTSHVVNTAWGLLSLVSAGYRVRTPLDRAAACLLRLQLPTGDWPQQHISGVFNRNCMISYANYRCLPVPSALLLG